MSMRNFMTVLVTLTLSSFAIAAEPVAQPQSKAMASTSAKQQTVKHAAAKPQAKPAAPKYYYVRGDSLPTSTAAIVSVAGPAVQTQTVTPEPGDVHTGRMVCELGNFVSVTPDPQQPSRFVVQMKKNTYLMTPVETTTGAVRLEDAQAGAMWLQLPHKSMLMNSKLGQRMADECQSEHQTVAAHAMKLNPPPSLLDGPTLAKK
jgi:hypothetical protein